MGLDITSKNDYFRFNWSGVSAFGSWNNENDLPNPFPNWNGANDGDVCNCNNEVDREKVQEWLTAFEEKFPDLANRGIGEAMRYLMYDVNELVSHYNKDEKWSKEDTDKWESYTALAWYWFLKDKMKTKTQFAYY